MTTSATIPHVLWSPASPFRYILIPSTWTPVHGGRAVDSATELVMLAVSVVVGADRSEGALDPTEGRAFPVDPVHALIETVARNAPSWTNSRGESRRMRTRWAPSGPSARCRSGSTSTSTRLKGPSASHGPAAARIEVMKPSGNRADIHSGNVPRHAAGARRPPQGGALQPPRSARSPHSDQDGLGHLLELARR